MSTVVGARRHTLAEYQRHLELYGSECLLETARQDLDDRELGQLKALIDSTERISRRHGDRWIHRGQDFRVKAAFCRFGQRLETTRENNLTGP